MAEAGQRMLLIFTLLGLLHIFTFSEAQDPGLYEVVTVDQCYSQPIPVKCDPGFMVRVLSAKHRQTEKCKSGYQDSGCVKEERGNPACVGNTTCVFTSPWMYISAECGYSNNFQIAYQCVPANIQQDICGNPSIQGQSGFLTTPNYPKKYPVSQNCTATIRVHPLHRVRVYILDLFLAYYSSKGDRRCVDKLWLEDAGGMRRSPEVCAGQERTTVFVSKTNEAVVRFTSADNEVKNAKGFWLYYEAYDASQEPEGTTPEAITRTTTTTTTTPEPETTTSAEKSTPWYFRYTNDNKDKNGDADSTDGAGATTQSSAKSSRTPIQDAGSADFEDPMIHRIHGMVKEVSNWAPKTILFGPSTTPSGTHGNKMEVLGGPHSPRPKVSRRKYLKTPVFSRTLDDIVAAGGSSGSRSSNTTERPGGMSERRRHKTLEAKKPSWIDALGKEYIAAISTGAGCLIILVGIICGLIANIKKKRKLIQPPQMPVTIKKPYNNVILAYTGADRETPGVPNLGFEQEGPKEVNGFSNPHFKADAPWLQLNGLLPIDEIPENLYAEVKQCDMDPENVRARAQFILGRAKSKSTDDLRLKRKESRRRVEKMPESSHPVHHNIPPHPPGDVGEGAGPGEGAPSTGVRAPNPNPLNLSLDSLDFGSQISCPSTVEIAEEEPGQEYYETIEDMYRDMALATARANEQLFNERLETLSLPSTPRSSRSAGAALMSGTRDPLVSTGRESLVPPGAPSTPDRGLHCIDTSYEATLLDHADVAL